MRRLYLIIGAVLLSTGLIAGPPTRITNLSILFETDNCPDFKTLIIPIKQVQNLIVVEARIDTLIGNFILDTGSPSLVLNKVYFRKGSEVDDWSAANASGSLTPLIRTSVENFSIRELYFEKLQAELSDLGHIENSRGIKILGLLGVNLFSSFEMVVDLHKDLMYLHRLDNNGQPEEERIVTGTPIIQVPFRMTNKVITMDVMVGTKKFAFCLDTGAETNAISNLLPAKVLQRFTVSRRIVLLGTGGSRSEVLMGTLDEVTVGPKPFKNMPFVISRLDLLGEAYGHSIDGILGYSFLVKGIFTINFAKKEFCMYPFDVSKP